MLYAKTRTLRTNYDFIICGAGASGCVLARRLAENHRATVLLIEAGSYDLSANITELPRWMSNLSTKHDWALAGSNSPVLESRQIQYHLGKITGGGTSINAGVWVRGHKNDWDEVERAAGLPEWGFEAVTSIYEKIEHWQDQDTAVGGDSGKLRIERSVSDAPEGRNRLSSAFINAATALGTLAYDRLNKELMEAHEGVSRTELTSHLGRRSSVFEQYVVPLLGGDTFDLLSESLVAKIVIDKGSASGVEIVHDGERIAVAANCEVIVCAGALQTPKLLMHSGVGPEAELRKFSIPVACDSPEVGRHLQDHPIVSVSWQASKDFESECKSPQAALFHSALPEGPSPDSYIVLSEYPMPGISAEYGLSWALGAALLHPRSRGAVSLASSDPQVAPLIQDGLLTDEEDMRALVKGLDLCKQLAQSKEMRPFAKHALDEDLLSSRGPEEFIRQTVQSCWHVSGSCRMGSEGSAVVDGSLRVFGVDKLRVADTSVLPRVTTGNTMAPAVVIGERAGQILRETYSLQ